MRDSTTARYMVVLHKPTLHMVLFGHGELDDAQDYADKNNGFLIKAKGEGIDVEFIHTLTCDPEDHKLVGVPVKKIPS